MLPHVTPGAHILLVTPREGAQREVMRLTVETGEQRRDLRLVYPADGELVIAGRVIAPDGTGVSCPLKVNGNGILASTRREIGGEFRFERLAPGAYSILVGESPGFQEALIVDVEAGREDVEIVLAPSRLLAGQVVDGSGSPVTEFEIAVQASGVIPSSRTFDREEFQLVTHPDGRFAFDVSDGWYEVFVRVDGQEPQLFTVGDVSAETSSGDLSFVLR